MNIKGSTRTTRTTRTTRPARPSRNSHRIRRAASALLALALFISLVSCGKIKDSSDKTSGNITLGEVADLADRLAILASIRCNGEAEDTEALIYETLSSDYAGQMAQWMYDTNRNEFIPLQDIIDETMRYIYEEEYIVATGGDPDAAGMVWEDQTVSEPAYQPDNEADNQTSEPSSEPSDQSATTQAEPDDLHDEPEVWPDEPEEIDGQQQEDHGKPEDVYDMPDEEITWASGSAIPTYDEWLNSEEANAAMSHNDGRIVENNGVLGVWSQDLWPSSDGYADLVIAGQVMPVYIGVEYGQRRLLGDYAYDFEVISYGLYENGTVIVVVQTKPRELTVDDEGVIVDNMSGSYKITLKGTVAKDQDSRLKFTPTPETYVHMVESFI